jgi:hypothetical protein
LRAHGSADWNALASTLNDGSLSRESLQYWTGRGWIVIAPDTPMVALAGPRFDPRLTLAEFCGAPRAERNGLVEEGEEGLQDEDA